jgi:hypothetical protein
MSHSSSRLSRAGGIGERSISYSSYWGQSSLGLAAVIAESASTEDESVGLALAALIGAR